MQTIRAARQRALENQIKRLERRLVPLRTSSNRVSWLRVLAFAVALGGAWALGAFVNPLAGWVALIVGLLIFLTVVLYHRRLESWIDTFDASRQVRADQLARMMHNWDALPLYNFAGAHDKHLALDLDITGQRSLHQLLDTTLTRQASQLLADWLTQNFPGLGQVHARQNIVRELGAFTRFRERFRLTLRLVLREPLEGAKLVQWLSVEFQSQNLRWTLPLATGLVVLNLILFAWFFWGGLPPYWIASMFAYAALALINQTELGAMFGALSRMETELTRFNAVLNYLEHVSYRAYPHLARLCAPFADAKRPPSASTRKIHFVAVGVGLRNNPVFWFVLNLLMPWDFFFAYLTNRYRVEVLRLLPTWLQVCYELDAYVALADFAYVNPEYVFPEISPQAQPIFAAQSLGHPLIPFAQTVRNDFTFHTPGELVIITGSNMAGKSTFLKSVGINLCLAYVGAPVVATHFRAIPLRLATCIRISDSITDGFSFFYAEVKCLKRLLDELHMRADEPLLYLIDEIFRGTNNRERLLGSRAYIEALLNENGVGLLATHDLELANLAEQRQQVRNFHFRDAVADGKLVFDYQIHPGPCPTTNALKIMQLEGLPIPTEE